MQTKCFGVHSNVYKAIIYLFNQAKTESMLKKANPAVWYFSLLFGTINEIERKQGKKELFLMELAELWSSSSLNIHPAWLGVSSYIKFKGILNVMTQKRLAKAIHSAWILANSSWLCGGSCRLHPDRVPGKKLEQNYCSNQVVQHSPHTGIRTHTQHTVCVC